MVSIFATYTTWREALLPCPPQQQPQQPGGWLFGRSGGALTQEHEDEGVEHSTHHEVACRGGQVCV